MTVAKTTIALALLAGSMVAQAQAVPPVTQGDLEAARQSFAIEAALEGCWLRTEEIVPCGGKVRIGSKCTSIQVKKVPCADEKKPDDKSKDKERGA